MSTDLLEVILSDIVIKSSALERVVSLRNYLVNKLFKGDESLKASAWISNLDPAILSDINQANIYATFDALEKEIKAIEPLILYLPYDLPEEEITKIGNKLRVDYGPHFLMEIQIDPNLIAGCALSYRGIYKDLSVKQKMTDQKSEILAEFGKYIKH